MNHFFLCGNLGEDPDLRHSKNGKPLCYLRIAVDAGFRDDAGKWQERTEWLSVVVFGKRGETLAEYARKGDRVEVHGKVSTYAEETKEGKRWRISLVALDAHTTRRAPGEPRKDATPRQERESPKQSQYEADDYGPSDDIPF